MSSAEFGKYLEDINYTFYGIHDFKTTLFRVRESNHLTYRVHKIEGTTIIMYLKTRDNYQWNVKIKCS